MFYSDGILNAEWGMSEIEIYLREYLKVHDFIFCYKATSVLLVYHL